jgi:hypothetical protein
VNFSPALKSGVLLLLVVLTLGWKLAVRRESDDLNEIQLKAAQFLVRQHFSVALSEKVGEGEPIIRATAGMCRLLVAMSSFDGWQSDVIRRYATAQDTIFVVYGGRLYAEQPTGLTATGALWSKIRRELGLSAQTMLALAVISTKDCKAEQLPWIELGL